MMGNNKHYQLNIFKKIPNEWNIKPFTEITSVITCGVAARPEYIEDNGIPFLSSLNVKQGEIIWNNYKLITEEKHIELTKNNKPEKNDILYSRVGSFGEAAVIETDIEFSIFVSLTLIKPIHEMVNVHFLKHLLNSHPYKELAKKNTTGLGVQNLNVGAVREFPIILPALKEQQKIAAILSSVDEAIEKTEQIIEQTEKVKKGLMQELLTKGIGHTEFKDSPFGEIPKNWNTTLVSDVATVNPEQLNSKTDDDYVVNYIDISSIENHEISSTSVYKFKNAPGRARRIVKTDDIIVSTVRPYLKGFTYIQEAHDNYICSTGFSVIRCKDVCLSNYLYHVILSDRFINYLITNMTGSSFPAVKADDVKNFIFPLPPLNEQIEIANFLDKYQKKVSIDRKKILNLKKVKQGLMQELLTGKKRVKVDDSEEVLS